MLFGKKIRSLRDEQGILQRQVAAYLEIDTPMFSKIERGDRRAKRSQVIQMATYFYIFRSISVQSVGDLQYRGQVNTFFLNSLPLAQLFLIHARFRQDDHRNTSLSTTSSSRTPFFLSKTVIL